MELKDYIDLMENPELTGINCKYTYTIQEYSTMEDLIRSFHNTSISFTPYCSQSCKPFYDDKGKANALSFGVDMTYPALLASGKLFDAYDTAFIEPSVEQNQ